MTMHLAPPYLSLIGKSKSKQKFRNSTAAKTAREIKDSWNDLQQKWSITKIKDTTFTTYKPKAISYRGSDKPKIPSLNSEVGVGVAVKKEAPVYTGDSMLGISIIHKSCLQPIFNHQDAIDVAKMRR